MSIKISELTSASSVGDSDYIPIVQEGTTKKATASMIKTTLPTISTSITSSSTNSEVAGAKAVYDSSLDVYSTSEQVVGTWIDGKPIYRKVVTGTTTAGANLDIQKNNISANIDTFIQFRGITVQPSGNISLIPYFAAEADRTSIYYASSLDALRIRAGSSYGFGDIAIIVEYTKTTDSAS